jgi:ubiquinone/menaquinone biosynthesis C-methylase UbiE
MNAAEHFICSSFLWRYLTHRYLLPTLIGNAHLGDHLLEIGAGYGAATSQLQAQVPRVTSLEYDHQCTLKLKSKSLSGTCAAVQGDAAHLPFAADTFSSVIAVLVLHHLKSPALQDCMFAETLRVLRPGGVFLAFEIPDSWLHRAGHVCSTFTPVARDSVFPRLTAARFSNITLDVRKGALRISAVRP